MCCGRFAPVAEQIASDDSPHRDAHGIAISRHAEYVWFFDRASNQVEIHKARTGRASGVVRLESAYSADPTPDLAVTSPDGQYMYVSLRGPNPLSGDPHASTGSTPGLMVIRVAPTAGPARCVGSPRSRTSIPAASNAADAHGIAYRPVGRTGERTCRRVRGLPSGGSAMVLPAVRTHHAAGVVPPALGGCGADRPLEDDVAEVRSRFATDWLAAVLLRRRRRRRRHQRSGSGRRVVRPRPTGNPIDND